MTSTDSPGTPPDLDLRRLRAPDRHPAVFAQFGLLPVEGSLLVVNDHAPEDLRTEFEAEHPGSHDWKTILSGPDEWHFQITKLASTPLPRVLLDTHTVAARTGEPGVSGAVWNIPVRERDLDSNVISLS